MVFNVPLRGQAGGADVVRLRRHYVSAAVRKKVRDAAQQTQ